MTEEIAYGPANVRARPDPAMAPFLPSEHLDHPYAVYDEQYYVTNADELQRAFADWLASDGD